MVEDTDEDSIALPTLWVGESETTVTLANQFNIGHQGVDEFVLTVGQVTNPLLTGDDEQKLEQARNLSYVPIRVVGRFTFSRERIVELIGVLTANLARYDESIKKQED